jgi:membrane-associated protein
MELLRGILEVVLHLDVHLTQLVNQYGALTYAILFTIIFAETGFVVTPFLPGDSLLFAAGAIAALGSLTFPLVLLILILAAVLGDTVNYWIGHFFGRKIVDNPKITIINQEHIDKTEQFFKKYGGKTIILARFVPIIRTFAPFVAGVGTMEYSKFITFNIIGGTLWVTILSGAGYFFGNLPFVRKNFEYVVFAIIIISLLPMVYEYIQHKLHPDIPGLSTEKLKKILRK